MSNGYVSMHAAGFVLGHHTEDGAGGQRQPPAEAAYYRQTEHTALGT